MFRKGEPRKIVSGVIHIEKNIVFLNVIFLSGILFFLGAPWAEDHHYVILAVAAASAFAGTFLAAFSPRKKFVLSVAIGVLAVIVVTLFLSQMATPVFALNVLHDFFLFNLIVGLVKIYLWGWEFKGDFYERYLEAQGIAENEGGEDS